MAFKARTRKPKRPAPQNFKVRWDAMANFSISICFGAFMLWLLVMSAVIAFG